MGFPSTSTPSAPASKSSIEGTPRAPNRTERAHCWEARDGFFKCLDAHGIVDGLKDEGLASQKCGKESVAFDRDCASSWVHYFKKRRVMEHTRNETLKRIKAEGAQEIPGVIQPGGGPMSK